MSLLIHREQLIKLYKDQSPASQYNRWFNKTATYFNDKQIDKVKSIDLAKKLGSEVKQCFGNSARAIMSGHNLRYCEGFVNWHGIPIEHAFCIDENNKVIDLTFGIDPKIRNKRAKKYGIDLNETVQEFGNEYFGVIIPKNIVLDILIKDEVYSPMAFQYWGRIK
jgi:hypothetical protein